jgi:hypothetical protein
MAGMFRRLVHWIFIQVDDDARNDRGAAKKRLDLRSRSFSVLRSRDFSGKQDAQIVVLRACDIVTNDGVHRRGKASFGAVVSGISGSRPNGESDTGSIDDRLNPAPLEFGDKFRSGGVLNPTIFFSFWVQLVTSSPSLLLLTTTRLDVGEFAKLPAVVLPTRRRHSRVLCILVRIHNGRSHEAVTQTICARLVE